MNSQLAPTEIRLRETTRVATVADALAWLSERSEAYTDARGWWHSYGKFVCVGVEGAPVTNHVGVHPDHPSFLASASPGGGPIGVSE